MDPRLVDLTCHYSSPLGEILLAGSGDALTGLWFDGQRHFGAGLETGAAEGWLPVFGDAFRWLDGYFAGRRPDFTPKLDLRGTPFQLAVWNALLDISYGETVTYGGLARRLARAGWPAQYGAPAPRAIGGAVGRNPVSLIVPCHRVVGAGGRLTGYAGGLDRKARLLQLERTGSF